MLVGNCCQGQRLQRIWLFLIFSVESQLQSLFKILFNEQGLYPLCWGKPLIISRHMWLSKINYRALVHLIKCWQDFEVGSPQKILVFCNTFCVKNQLRMTFDLCYIGGQTWSQLFFNWNLFRNTQLNQLQENIDGILLA